LIPVTCEGAGRVPLDELIEFQGDIKTLSPANAEKLRARILRNGINAPVFVWRTEAGKHYILDGHQRCAVLRQLREEGYTFDDIPVAYIDAKSKKDAKQKLLGITSQYGEFELDALIEFTADITVDFGELSLVDGKPIEFVIDDEPIVEDEVPEDNVPEIVEAGQLWRLGEHRLMCGDSTNADDVARLFGEGKPMLMVTDPPYGVNYDPAWRQREAEKGNLSYAARRVGTVDNDDRADWTEAWDLFPGSVAYTWSPAGALLLNTGTALEKSGFEIRNMIIWSKTHLPIGRGHYHWRHEPCWYAVRKGASAHWIGDRKQSTVWPISLDRNVEGGHSTQKPVECMGRPIRNHEGEVYDPFVGSGTTLIAAEQLGRRCYAMEINPHYCDVVIERYKRWCESQGATPTVELIE
jgi:DNA modification methylase